MEPCNCVYCNGKKPIPEAERGNCKACGEYIYWAWDKPIKTEWCVTHGWRNYINDQPHYCNMEYSHGKRLGKVWI